jgi:hypothetical protein
MIYNVIWLDTTSHIVRLLRGSELDGMMNGNIAMPAVKITPASITELALKAVMGFFALVCILSFANIQSSQNFSGN